MRAKFDGSGEEVLPLTLTLSDGVPFIPADYIARGFISYIVLAIGAAGGFGGYKRAAGLISEGGGPGGGGLHLRKGYLEDLPAEVEVIVGSAGADGTDFDTSGSAPTAGGDGGYSGFNTLDGNPGLSSAVASGGEGGLPALGTGPFTTSLASGGDGGIGNSVVAGGGALGGSAQIPDSLDPNKIQPQGADGVWDGVVGSGGGGGAGGVGSTTVTTLKASRGGHGSTSITDYSVQGNGSPPQDQLVGDVELNDMIPGAGGGAMAMGLGRESITYELGDDPDAPGEPGLPGRPVGGRGDHPFLKIAPPKQVLLPVINWEALIFGSRTPGVDPNGAVVIRLSA